MSEKELRDGSNLYYENAKLEESYFANQIYGASQALEDALLQEKDGDAESLVAERESYNELQQEEVEPPFPRLVFAIGDGRELKRDCRAQVAVQFVYYLRKHLASWFPEDYTIHDAFVEKSVVFHRITAKDIDIYLAHPYGFFRPEQVPFALSYIEAMHDIELFDENCILVAADVNVPVGRVAPFIKPHDVPNRHSTATAHTVLLDMDVYRLGIGVNPGRVLTDHSELARYLHGEFKNVQAQFIGNGLRDAMKKVAKTVRPPVCVEDDDTSDDAPSNHIDGRGLTPAEWHARLVAVQNETNRTFGENKKRVHEEADEVICFFTDPIAKIPRDERTMEQRQALAAIFTRVEEHRDTYRNRVEIERAARKKEMDAQIEIIQCADKPYHAEMTYRAFMSLPPMTPVTNEDFVPPEMLEEYKNSRWTQMIRYIIYICTKCGKQPAPSELKTVNGALVCKNGCGK